MMLPPTGHALWAQLHGLARRLPDGPLSPDHQQILRAFLEAFSDAVEQGSLDGGCQCAAHWAQHLANRPPVFTDRIAFLQWSYDIHDDVNQSLKKPRLDLNAV